MRTRNFVTALLLGATFASASAYATWTSTDDTTARAINTAGNAIAVGAEATASGGQAVAATASGSNGVGVKAFAPYGKGVYATGGQYGVHAKADSMSGGIAVWAQGNTRGVEASALAVGVHGEGGDVGVEGWSYNGEGVFGRGSGSGTGVRAVATSSGYGLDAQSSSGIGAYIRSDGNTGLVASGYYTGAEISATNLYGNGLFVGPGGRGYGVYTYGGHYGVYGSASSYDGSDPSYGVVGDAYGGDATYGVTGYANGGTYENWAGYFEGDVYVGGTLVNPSDLRFKTNIRDYRGGLEKILSLRIRSYDMKVDEYKGRLNLPSGTQVGVIAQEAEKVLPEIVHAVTSPARLTPEDRKKGVKKEDVKFKSVSYEALIPVLVQAIQELQAQVDSLKAARR